MSDEKEDEYLVRLSLASQARCARPGKYWIWVPSSESTRAADDPKYNETWQVEHVIARVDWVL